MARRRVKLIKCNVLCPACKTLYRAEIARTHYLRYRDRFPHLPPLMCKSCLDEKCARQAEREREERSRGNAKDECEEADGC